MAIAASPYVSLKQDCEDKRSIRKDIRFTVGRDKQGRYRPRRALPAELPSHKVDLE
jgi:hypothetical protein